MKKITIETIINNNIEKVWEYWNDPKHIVNWAFASDDWESPYAENDIREGGQFLTRMSAKDKSSSFDFVGRYTDVVPNERIEYIINDGRTVTVIFEKISDEVTKITEEFEMENENTEEVQRTGWQSILDNFKKYVESKY